MTNNRKGKHLTFTERLQIEIAQKQGMKPKEIALMIGKSVRTIYYELKRGTYQHKINVYDKYYGDKIGEKFELRYSPDKAEERYRQNLQAKGAPLKIGNDYKLAEYIENRIVDGGLTPLSVLGEIKRNKLPFKTTICVRTLYAYIYKHVFLRLEMKHLPLKGTSKKRRNATTIARAPRGTSIEKRPAAINDKTEFGHWEMDCVDGPTKNSLLVLTERITHKEFIFTIPNKKTETIVHCINILERRYGKSFRKIFKSITVDNGSEFSDVKGMERSIYRGQRTKFFYCHPYSSWERGTNERMNREIRRKIPKGTDLSTLTPQKVQEVEDWINNYPRQVLNFATANELFNAEISRI